MPNPDLFPLLAKERRAPIVTTITLHTYIPPGPGPLGLESATFLMLNASKPDLTDHCWLYLDAKPLYYEGIAIKKSYTLSPDSQTRRWQQPTRGRLTLPWVTGSGLCVGHPSYDYIHLCNLTQKSMGAGYLIPPDDTWWACASGLTPCVKTQVLNQTRDFCILVQLVPQITYCPDDTIFYQSETLLRQGKREVITAVLLSALLGVGMARGYRNQDFSSSVTGSKLQSLKNGYRCRHGCLRKQTMKRTTK